MIFCVFLGPWHEMKKKPKTLIYLEIFKALKKPKSLKPNLLILEVENKKSEVNTQPIPLVADSCPGAVLLDTTWPRKRDHCRVFAAMLWSRASSFDARLRTASQISPLAYKYPLVLEFLRRRVLQFSFLLFRIVLVVVVLLLLYFLFLQII